MLLDGNKRAQKKYLGGDRSSDMILDYFHRAGVKP